MTRPTILPHVSSIPAYPPGKPIDAVAREFGLNPDGIVKLASNESPFGACPGARAAMAACIEDIALYPDFDCHALRSALSERHGLAPELILPATGSSDIFGLAARACLAPGDVAACPQYSFVGFEGAVRATGAVTHVTPSPGFVPDLEALAQAAQAGARIVYVATPGNPSGAVCEPDALMHFLRTVPDDVLVLLDEAYRDYVDPAARIPTADLLATRTNLLILRTFSKIHGLAGLRVGYALGDAAVIGALRRLQTPFAVSAMGEAAAVAALADDIFVEQARRSNALWRRELTVALQKRGLRVAPSEGNFLLVEVGDGARMFDALQRRGVIVRPVGNYGLPEWLRVTIGREDENAMFLGRLDEMLAHAH